MGSYSISDPALQSQAAVGLGGNSSSFYPIPSRQPDMRICFPWLLCSPRTVCCSQAEEPLLAPSFFQMNIELNYLKCIKGTSLTVLWKIAFQITRLYKAHINLGPKDIQIALASVLYCDGTLLIMPGSKETSKVHAVRKINQNLSPLGSLHAYSKPSWRCSLWDSSLLQEINSNCTGREVNVNSKLGPSSPDGFLTAQELKATKEAATAAPVPRGDV